MIELNLVSVNKAGIKTLGQLVAAADKLGLEPHIQLVRRPMVLMAEATIRAIWLLSKRNNERRQP